MIKKVSKWLESVQALSIASEAAPQTTFISVGDREADVYELFAMERSVGVELLVRASWNRGVDSAHDYFWETVRAAPVLGSAEVCVPRRPGKPMRRCTLALRCMPLTLKPPQTRKRLGPVKVWAILATEATPATKDEGIEWLLLTTVPTSSADEIIERVHWYTCRWTIEVWHRVLKTGCCIESRQLETVERLAVALTLYSIIAWRILYATMLARTNPDLPCTIVLTKNEWQALYCISIASLSPQRLHLPWRKQCCGLQNSVASWLGKATAYPAHRCCGEDSCIYLTSLTCFSSCNETNKLWVKISAELRGCSFSLRF